MGIEGLNNLAFEFGNLFKVVAPQAQNQVMRRIGLEAFSGMVMKSPVDTGRFRANWSVRFGAPRADSDDRTDKQPFGSKPSAASEQLVYAQINAAKSATTMYICNSLPYAVKLEEGHSKQGSHMVELTVMEIKRHYGI